MITVWEWEGLGGVLALSESRNESILYDDAGLAAVLETTSSSSIPQTPACVFFPILLILIATAAWLEENRNVVRRSLSRPRACPS